MRAEERGREAHHVATVARGGGLLLEPLDVLEQLRLALHQLPRELREVLLRVTVRLGLG